VSNEGSIKDYKRGEWTTEARQKCELEYHCRHLERLPLGMPYPQQVKRVVNLTKRLGGHPLIGADQTGVGRPVVDSLVTELEEAVKGTDVRPTVVRITITGGAEVTRMRGGVNVPKVDLISAPLVLMQNDRLLIAEDLKLRETLVRELLNFKRKINISTANTTYEAWREGDHDDLVLSLATAAWAGQEMLRKKEYVRAPGVVVLDGPIF
jgi:hypothetical protein